MANRDVPFLLVLINVIASRGLVQVTFGRSSSRAKVEDSGVPFLSFDSEHSKGFGNTFMFE